MAKLYVFGIGGTGSRVIKSLAMLLASGVDISGYEIVPIIIDPDEANGDVTRTIDVLKNYQQIHAKLSFSDADKNQFFKTKISNVNQNFRLVLSDIKNDRFKDYIQYSGLDESNKALISLLFSDENLNSDMEVGFKGNPNIGSVVLNQFNQSEDFKNFASTFNQEDRIFIISSIFGGTGAAGFPLLVKNIRNASHNLSTWKYLQDAPIGAITMLPYFGVAPDDDSKIDKSTFISKTKAALSYYDVNISGNNSVNALYYLGDDLTKDYPNVEGSINQKNDAHFLELAAALSIVDFSKIDAVQVKCENGTAENPIYKEFGIKSNSNTIIFENLGTSTQLQLKKPLTQYTMFLIYLRDKINSNTDQNWAKNINVPNLLTQPFYNNYLKTFNQYYIDWLKEMSLNQRSFTPLNLDVDDDNLFEMVKGVKPHTSLFQQKNYGRYDFQLSKNDRDISKTSTPEQQLMDLFYNTTESLVKEKYKF